MPNVMWQSTQDCDVLTYICFFMFIYCQKGYCFSHLRSMPSCSSAVCQELWCICTMKYATFSPVFTGFKTGEWVLFQVKLPQHLVCVFSHRTVHWMCKSVKCKTKTWSHLAWSVSTAVTALLPCPIGALILATTPLHSWTSKLVTVNSFTVINT